MNSLHSIGGKQNNLYSIGGNKGIKSYLTISNILILFAVIILFTVVGYIYYKKYISTNSATYKPNNEQVQSLSNKSGDSTAELLFFYADWCPHCKTAKPIWNDLKTEYASKTINGYTIVFTEVNCSEETTEVDQMMNKYNVEGYPTIKLLKDEQVIEYDAKPTKETLTQFLNSVL